MTQQLIETRNFVTPVLPKVDNENGKLVNRNLCS